MDCYWGSILGFLFDLRFIWIRYATISSYLNVFFDFVLDFIWFYQNLFYLCYMEEKKDNRGGVRINSGRKKLSNGEKKVEIKFWIENKYTFPFGGVEKAKGFAMEMIKNGNNPVMERVSIQNLNEPTHQIKPITDEKPTTNYEVKIEPKPMSAVTGDFEAIKKKILACERVSEIEAIYKEIKTGLFTFRQKAELENLAKQHSITFYND